MAKKKNYTKILDKEWSEAVKKRDILCQMCLKDSKKLNTHHIFPRTMKKFRWDLMNGIALCPRCHRLGFYSAHQNALYFSYWLSRNKQEVYFYLMKDLNGGIK